tara:strand:- start:1614 stop:1802 length:189 start_codon:yes stop_codon:yes gene_type:complete
MRIFSGMEKNYFDKFVEDLEVREDARRQQLEQLEKAREMWEKRMQLDQRYREHTAQRIRYTK